MAEIDISERTVVVRSINKTISDTRSHFTPVPSDITVDQVIEALLASSSIDSAELNF